MGIIGCNNFCTKNPDIMAKHSVSSGTLLLLILYFLINFMTLDDIHLTQINRTFRSVLR